MATQTDLAVTLAAMVEDSMHSEKDAVLAILQAVQAATCHPDGVTASSVREETPEEIRQQYPHHQGAVIGNLVRKKILIPTGEYAPSGNDASGNRHRPVPIYRCNSIALLDYIDERSR